MKKSATTLSLKLYKASSCSLFSYLVTSGKFHQCLAFMNICIVLRIGEILTSYNARQQRMSRVPFHNPEAQIQRFITDWLFLQGKVVGDLSSKSTSSRVTGGQDAQKIQTRVCVIGLATTKISWSLGPEILGLDPKSATFSNFKTKG